jgi:hypothetical protein
MRIDAHTADAKQWILFLSDSEALLKAGVVAKNFLVAIFFTINFVTH